MLRTKTKNYKDSFHCSLILHQQTFFNETKFNTLFDKFIINKLFKSNTELQKHKTKKRDKLNLFPLYLDINKMSKLL